MNVHLHAKTEHCGLVSFMNVLINITDILANHHRKHATSISAHHTSKINI